MDLLHPPNEYFTNDELQTLLSFSSDFNPEHDDSFRDVGAWSISDNGAVGLPPRFDFSHTMLASIHLYLSSSLDNTPHSKTVLWNLKLPWGYLQSLQDIFTVSPYHLLLVLRDWKAYTSDHYILPPAFAEAIENPALQLVTSYSLDSSKAVSSVEGYRILGSIQDILNMGVNEASITSRVIAVDESLPFNSHYLNALFNKPFLPALSAHRHFVLFIIQSTPRPSILRAPAIKQIKNARNCSAPYEACTSAGVSLINTPTSSFPDTNSASNSPYLAPLLSQVLTAPATPHPILAFREASASSSVVSVPLPLPIARIATNETSVYKATANNFMEICCQLGFEEENIQYRELGTNTALAKLYYQYRDVRDLLEMLGFTKDAEATGLENIYVEYPDGSRESLGYILSIHLKWSTRTFHQKRATYEWAEKMGNYVWTNVTHDILDSEDWRTDAYSIFRRIQYLWSTPGYLTCKITPSKSGTDVIERRASQLRQSHLTKYRTKIEKNISLVSSS